MISFLQPNADASGARNIVAKNASSVVFVHITTRVRCVPLFTTAENNYCHVKHGQSCHLDVYLTSSNTFRLLVGHYQFEQSYIRISSRFVLSVKSNTF